MKKDLRTCSEVTLATDADKLGFGERNGYHMYGDPFREQRHWGD